MSKKKSVKRKVRQKDWRIEVIEFISSVLHEREYEISDIENVQKSLNLLEILRDSVENELKQKGKKKDA